jgi:hypothetical protein
MPHGPSAHRRDDCPLDCAGASNIPRSSTLCPTFVPSAAPAGGPRQAWSSLAPSRYRLRYDLCLRYAVHHGLIAGRYALCRVGLLFPTCVRGCAAQSPLIFKPGN